MKFILSLFALMHLQYAPLNSTTQSTAPTTITTMANTSATIDPPAAAPAGPPDAPPATTITTTTLTIRPVVEDSSGPVATTAASTAVIDDVPLVTVRWAGESDLDTASGSDAESLHSADRVLDDD